MFLKAFLWVSKVDDLVFFPLSVVSAVRLFTRWLSVPANSFSFFCGCTDLHKLRLSAAPNKLKFAPFFFLTTGFFFSWRHVWTLKLCTVQGHCITTISSIPAGLAGWSDEFNCQKSFLRTRQTQHNSHDDTVVEIWSARPPQLYFKNNHSFLCKSFLPCIWTVQLHHFFLHCHSLTQKFKTFICLLGAPRQRTFFYWLLSLAVSNGFGMLRSNYLEAQRPRKKKRKKERTAVLIFDFALWVTTVKTRRWTSVTCNLWDLWPPNRKKVSSFQVLYLMY